MCKEPTAALGSKLFYMFWLMDPGTVIGTHNNVPEPTSAMTWRARTGVLEVMTGRTWLDPGLSHQARITR